MLERAEGLVSRAVSFVALNAVYRIDIDSCTLQSKTYAHSLSFGASFALIGTLQWSRGREKSASRLLGHPLEIGDTVLLLFI